MILQYPISPNHTIIVEPEGLKRMVAACKGQVVAFDFETGGLAWWAGQHPVGYAIAVWPVGELHPEAWYVPFAHRTVERQCPEDAARQAFADIMAGAAALVAHNAKFDINSGRAAGWATPPLEVPIHDTMIQAVLIREDRRFKLEKLAEEVLGSATIYGDAWEASKLVDSWLVNRAKSFRMSKSKYLNGHGHAEVPVAIEGEYSCRDAAHCLYLHAAQHKKALAVGEPHEERRRYLYHNEMQMVRALADMEFHGQRIDTGYLSDLADNLDNDLADIGNDLSSTFGINIEWNNDTQLRDLLFNRLALPVTKLTKGGAASVDRSVLLELSAANPALLRLNEWREIFKVRSTYTDSLVAKCDSNGRLHASFVQHGTDTGRLSSRNPNLQNIPSRHPKLSKAVRQAFVVDEGTARVYCDYSQIELRLLAWTTGCRSLTKAYDSPAYMQLVGRTIDYDTYRKQRRCEPSTDVHGAVAESVFGATKGSADFKRARSAAKIINFGVPYGGGPKLLTDNPSTRLSKRDARNYFNQYHQNNPEIEATKRRLIDSMIGHPETRFVNWAGRTRHGAKLRHPAENIRARTERGMFASLVQGSAAELTRFSIVRLWEAQQRGEMPAISTSTIHDEVQVDCQVGDLREVASLTQQIMEDFTGLFGSVPVIADLEVTMTDWSAKEDYDELE